MKSVFCKFLLICSYIGCININIYVGLKIYIYIYMYKCPDPRSGSKAISNGKVRPSAISTVRREPSYVETSMRLDPDSIIYR